MEGIGGALGEDEYKSTLTVGERQGRFFTERVGNGDAVPAEDDDAADKREGAFEEGEDVSSLTGGEREGRLFGNGFDNGDEVLEENDDEEDIIEGILEEDEDESKLDEELNDELV